MYLLKQNTCRCFCNSEIVKSNHSSFWFGMSQNKKYTLWIFFIFASSGDYRNFVLLYSILRISMFFHILLVTLWNAPLQSTLWVPGVFLFYKSYYSTGLTCNWKLSWIHKYSYLFRGSLICRNFPILLSRLHGNTEVLFIVKHLKWRTTNFIN